MKGQIISGTQLAAQYQEKLKEKVDLLKEKGITPGLAVILVGEDSASKVYVASKGRKTEELGMYAQQHTLPITTSQQELLTLIDQLNNDARIHGILVQLPLPEGIDEDKIITAIDPSKDVDAFHPCNVGGIMIGQYPFLPCTPAGVMELIKSTGETIEGKHCVVLGRSNIVGKPMAMLLLHANGTVTICHSRTKNMKDITRQADILVSAIGLPKFITADMVKPGAIVIDVGMNRDGDGKLCGDVDFQQVKEVAGYITPVPGGVGPMTITMLMDNTVTAASRALK